LNWIKKLDDNIIARLHNSKSFLVAAGQAMNLKPSNAYKNN